MSVLVNCRVPLAMAATLRRLQGLRHSLSSFTGQSHLAFATSFSKAGPSCGYEAEQAACSTSVRRSLLRDLFLVECVSSSAGDDLSLQSGASEAVEFQQFSGSWGGRFTDSPVRMGRFSKDLGLGVRYFASKANNSGGKTRNDAVAGQMLASAGPSATEKASRLMEAALNALSIELSKLRTGRVTPGMLDHVNVMSHGVHTPLAHVAAVSVSSVETLTVMPYDPSIVKEVEKAIRGSPLKLNPVAEGEVLRVPIPKLTKEHIQSMSKLVGKAGEISKLSVRRARKDAMDLIAKGGYSKDEVKRFQKEVEDVTKKYVQSVEEACKLREKEIMGSS